MPRDSRTYLYDIQRAARRVQRFTVGKTLDSYLQDDLVQSAVERQLEIIGEAVSQLFKVAPAIAEQLPDHRRMIAFRNILIHAYASVDSVIVWGVLEADLDPLLESLELLLKD